MRWPKSPTKQQFEWTAAFYCLDTLVRRHRGESSDCLSSYSSNTSVKTCGFKWAGQTVDCSLSLRFIRNILQSNKKSVIHLSKYCSANFPLRSHFWAVKQQFLFLNTSSCKQARVYEKVCFSLRFRYTRCIHVLNTFFNSRTHATFATHCYLQSKVLLWLLRSLVMWFWALCLVYQPEDIYIEFWLMHSKKIKMSISDSFRSFDQKKVSMI